MQNLGANRVNYGQLENRELTISDSLRKQPSFFAPGRNAIRAGSEEGRLFSQATSPTAVAYLRPLCQMCPLLVHFHETFYPRTGFETQAHCNSELMRIHTENVWKRHVRTFVFDVFPLLH